MVVWAQAKKEDDMAGQVGHGGLRKKQNSPALLAIFAHATSYSR